VCRTINFYGQLSLRAIEIYNVLFDALLPSELATEQLLPFQQPPQRSLRVRGIIPKKLPSRLLCSAVKRFFHCAIPA
jgi:hypothetical protein